MIFPTRQRRTLKLRGRASERTALPLTWLVTAVVSVLTVNAPFAAEPALGRAVIDRSLKLNLAAPGRFELELAVEPPEACGHLTLYFRSGGGWYGASGGVADAGWQTVRYSKASFRTEGSPAGWDQI